MNPGLVCAVCGAMLQSNGVSWDCPRAGQQTAYEPHYINPHARELAASKGERGELVLTYGQHIKGVKIRVPDRRVTTQNNMARRAAGGR